MQVLFFLYFLQDEDAAAVIAIGADKKPKAAFTLHPCSGHPIVKGHTVIRVGLSGILDRKRFAMRNKRFHGGEARRGTDVSKGQGCLARCAGAGGGRANKFSSIWRSHPAFRTRAIRLAPARVRYSPSSKNFTAVQEMHNTPTLGRGTSSLGETS
jgi:hypothetical protein